MGICPPWAFWPGAFFEVIVHDIQVKTLLSAEEYLAFRAVCDTLGVSMSSRLRMLVKLDVRNLAADVSNSMDETGQDRD